LWFDLMVIPANARNIDAAYKFLNFILDPEVAAANTNYLQYANPNKASAPYINPELMNDPGLYPPAEVLTRLQVLQPLPENAEEELQRIWKNLSP
jgi:putrescine transport system substrate-binding protein